MNYEFHVGDYVETINGEVGYIESVTNYKDFFEIYGVLTRYNSKFEFHDCAEHFHRYFRRIGKYDFMQQDKKIEKLASPFVTVTIDGKKKPICSITHYDDYQINFNAKEFTDKINELIDAVNELREKDN